MSWVLFAQIVLLGLVGYAFVIGGTTRLIEKRREDEILRKEHGL